MSNIGRTLPDGVWKSRETESRNTTGAKEGSYCFQQQKLPEKIGFRLWWLSASHTRLLLCGCLLLDGFKVVAKQLQQAILLVNSEP